MSARDRAHEIPLLDLAAQHREIADDVEATVLAVLRSGRYVLGEAVARFEQEMAAHLGVAHAIGVASGSDALLLALMALDVRPGDEVVTSVRPMGDGDPAREAIAGVLGVARVTPIATFSLAVRGVRFDAAAIGWGADSRPAMADDHRR